MMIKCMACHMFFFFKVSDTDFESEIFVVSRRNREFCQPRRYYVSCYVHIRARFMCWRRIIFSLPELELMFANRRKISPSLIKIFIVFASSSSNSIVVIYVQGGDKLLWLWNGIVWRKLFFSIKAHVSYAAAAIKIKPKK